jgi:MFS superfamily sulfate permease-like transporter
MVAGIASSSLFGPAGHGVKMLGTIPAGLPAPALPAISAGDWHSLFAGAAGLALISYASAMVTARGFATKNHYMIDPNREFIALGVADIGAGLLQGFAISGADSRTAMNDSMGGKTQVVGLVTAVVLALTLMFLTGPLAGLPMPVLAAVLIKAAMGLFDLKGLATLRHVSHKEFLLCMITLLGTITVGVLQGVLVAIAVAMIMLVAKSSRPHDAVLGRMPGTDTYLDKAAHPEAELIPSLVIYRFDAGLLFYNADHFKAPALSVIRSAAAPVRHLLVDAETMPLLDTTGAATLDDLRGELERQGIGMAVAAAKDDVTAMLERSGFLAQLGPERIFAAIEPAVQALCVAGTSQALSGTNRPS